MDKHFSLLFNCLRSFCFAISLGSICHADEGSEEAASYVSGYIANTDSLRQFDVVFRYETQRSDTTGAAEELIIITRMVRDLDTDACLCVSSKTSRNVPASKETGTPETRVSVVAAMHSKNDGWVRQLPGHANHINESSVPKVIELIGDVPNLRLVGFAEFPFPLFDEELTSRALAVFNSPSSNYSFSRSAEGICQIILRIRKSESKGRILTWNFDSERLVPNGLRCDSEDLVSHQRVPFYSERYKFIDIKGSYLPSEILGERMKLTTEKGGEKLRTPEMYEAEFRWLSLNEKLDERYFTPEILRDTDAITSMVLPTFFSRK